MELWLTALFVTLIAPAILTTVASTILSDGDSTAESQWDGE